jgi:hypothetical protein
MTIGHETVLLLTSKIEREQRLTPNAREAEQKRNCWPNLLVRLVGFMDRWSIVRYGVRNSLCFRSSLTARRPGLFLISSYTGTAMPDTRLS